MAKKLLRKLIPRKFASSALEIGETEVKFVALDPRGDLPEVTTVARYPSPPDVFGENFDEDTLDGILAGMVAEYDLVGTDVVSVIGGDNVVTRHVRLPRMSGKEMYRAVLEEAGKVMPVPMDDVVVRYIVLDEYQTEGVVQMDVLFAAVSRSLVYRYHALLSRAGLTLTALDLPTVALWRLYRDNLIGDVITAIIEIGSKRTNLVICSRDGLRFTRTLPVGGDLLTLSIAGMYGIDFNRAREMKENDAVILAEDELEGADSSTVQLDMSLRDGLGELVGEIRRSLEFYSSRDNSRPVERIILSGGASKLAGFENFMTEAMNVEARVVRPATINIIESGDLAFDPSLAVVYGLALREVQA